jgi:hypothetical protein
MATGEIERAAGAAAGFATAGVGPAAAAWRVAAAGFVVDAQLPAFGQQALVEGGHAAALQRRDVDQRREQAPRRAHARDFGSGRPR